MIASNVDGIPEAFSVAGYGQLVRPGSVGNLAEAMAEWAQKPRLSMEERWKLHRLVAERFSLEKAARELAQLYDELTAKNA